jgi:hypothetical protein
VAALAAIVGTAPLSHLGGQDIDWTSGYGVLIAVGLVLLGFSLAMVLAVLVPGITGFPDLMKPIVVDFPRHHHGRNIVAPRRPAVRSSTTAVQPHRGSRSAARWTTTRITPRIPTAA